MPKRKYRLIKCDKFGGLKSLVLHKNNPEKGLFKNYCFVCYGQGGERVMATEKLKPCPRCKESWLYLSVGDYSSRYESLGYRVNCKCGYAWFNTKFYKTKREAMESWNRRVKDGNL